MEFLTVLLGILIVLLAGLAIYFAISLSKRTEALLKSEDAIAKNMIEDGHRRTQEMVKGTQEMIEEGRRETRELIKYIANLIAREGEITREVIKEAV